MCRSCRLFAREGDLCREVYICHERRIYAAGGNCLLWIASLCCRRQTCAVGGDCLSWKANIFVDAYTGRYGTLVSMGPPISFHGALGPKFLYKL